MSEHEEPKAATEEERDEPELVQNGMVRGVPGKKVVVNGVLDLRGVPAEQVAAMEKVVLNGVLLLDEDNRGALAGVQTVINGTMLVAGPDLRVIVGPDHEFSKAMLEGMPPAQQLMIIGNVYFRPDVPPALVAEKLAESHIVGIVIACEGVHGALMGRAEITGVSVVLADGVRSVVRSVGDNELTQDYLSRLDDGTTYVNVGSTTIAEEVSEKLLSQKIAAYHNIGSTIAPQPLLSLLKTRCATNLGNFSEPGDL
jgi:hypothetical protein